MRERRIRVFLIASIAFTRMHGLFVSCMCYLQASSITCIPVNVRCKLRVSVCKHTYVEARTRATGRLIGEWPAKSLARPIETSSSHLFPISGRLVIGNRLPTNKCTRLGPRRVFANCLVLSNLFSSYAFSFARICIPTDFGSVKYLYASLIVTRSRRSI